MPARFKIHPHAPEAAHEIQTQLHIPYFMAAVLVERGYDTPEAAREFMNPSLGRDWQNPYDIAGMQDVVDALERAIRAKKRIGVFGDFDVDGISSAAVMTRGLRALKADAFAFVPRRSDEGYGLSRAAIDRLMQSAPEVVITVDCGIACKEEVRYLSSLGVEVLVTDHHEPADLVPEGVPVCDPKLVHDAPQSILAGVGVALKTICALGARFGQPHLWREFTDIATLGTVADLMPLISDNRALVADGVARMNDNPRPCIAALLRTSGASSGPVGSISLSFSVIPRLNAAGRMGDATLALDLLLCDDPVKAADIAQRLEDINNQRRSIELELTEHAMLQAEQHYHGQRALVVWGEGWHEGVKGIVASRLVRTYGVPVILFTVDEETGEARGSGRSVGQVNLFKAIENVSEYTTRFGGHEAAVGVTLPKENLPAFTEALCAYMDTLPKDHFHPRIDIDTTVELSELTLDNVAKLDMLAPFGQGNQRPKLLARDVILTHRRAVGADKNHFSSTLTDGLYAVSSIMFHATDIDMLMECEQLVNAAFEVQIDEWRGRKSVKAMVSSLAPAAPCTALDALISPEEREFVFDLYARSQQDIYESDDILSQITTEVTEHVSHEDDEDQDFDQARLDWRAFAREHPDEVEARIVHELIGDSSMFDVQKNALRILDSDTSLLSVMATGRGKSLIFHVDAAKRALLRGQASLFVFPLRALIADQAYHLRNTLARLGVTSEVLTGETSPRGRERIFEGLESGDIDIILTTPEFLDFHANEFARIDRIGLLVVDEAHHVGLAKTSHRPAYMHLGNVVHTLGDPCVLALTATAGPLVAERICKELHIERILSDPAMRKNLHLIDKRNLQMRDAYIATLIATGEKTAIYVHSRMQALDLARTLRRQVPQLAMRIGFYHAGLTHEERTRITEMFRDGSFNVIVTTSAFGEGVNIPDIRHVVLYHMPYNDTEFNQMSGRAGRDGADAWVHALFGREDATTNEAMLNSITPSHHELGVIYKTLTALQKQRGVCTCADKSITPASLCDGWFTISPESLNDAVKARDPRVSVTRDAFECALAVFRELGFLEIRSFASDSPMRLVRMVPDPTRVELTQSVRYREGLDEQQIFRDFSDWVLHASTTDLLKRIQRPILPEE